MNILRKPIHFVLVFCIVVLVLSSSGKTASATLPTTMPPVMAASTDQSQSPSTPTPLTLGVVGQFGGPVESVAVAPNGYIAYVGVGQTVVMLDLRAGPEPVQVGASEILPDRILDLTVKRQTVYAVVQREGLWMIDVIDPAHPVVVGYISASRAQGVAVAGNYLYLADAGLTILDITQPHQPVQVSHLPLAGYPRGVTVSGGYAYIATYDGLQIVDVTNPASPVALGFVAAEGSWSVAVMNGYAYVTRIEFGFDVVNVANPAAPAVVAQVELGYTYDISATSQAVFVVGSDGLRTFDITDPLHPAPTGIFSTDSESVGLVVRDNMAYVAARSDGFYVVDVSELTSITTLGLADTPGKAEGIALAGGFAYVADGAAGLRVLSLADPLQPTEVGHLATSTYANNLTVVGTRAYIAEERDYNTGTAGGLAIVDVADPAHPVQLGRIETPDSATSVSVRDNLAYVTAMSSGLRIIDVSNPAVSHEIGFIDTPGDALDVSVVVRGYKVVAFVADLFWGVRIIDVTNPAQPVEISHLPQDSGSLWTGVAARGNYLYVTNAGPDLDLGGIYVIDVSNLNAPRFVGLAHARRAMGVTIKDDRAYVSGDDLTVFDLTDPVQPVELGAYKSSGAVAVTNGLAYQAAGNAGVRVVNVGGLTTPVLAGTWDIAQSADVAVVGAYGLLTGDASLRVLDLADPSRPKLVGQAAATTPTNRIVAAGNRAYVTQESLLDPNLNRSTGGMRIYDVSVPSAPVGRGFFATPDGRGMGAMAVEGRYVYAVSSNVVAPGNKLYVIDTVNVNAPVQVGLVTAASSIFDVAVQGQFAYIITEDDFLRVLSLANPQQPVQVGSVAIPDSARSLAVAGSYAYIGFVDSNNGLYIVDVANPAAPSIAGVLPGVRDVSALEAQHQQLYPAGSAILRVFDLSVNPAAPQQIGQVAHQGGDRPTGMAVAGNMVLLPHHEDGLFIVRAAPVTHRLTLPLVFRSRSHSWITPD